MDDPLIETKFQAPPLRREAIDRPRLMAKLDQAETKRLALVRAPAGFGKTTLLSVWAQRKRKPLAWLALDEADQHLVVFLRYLIQALQGINPDLGASALALLASGQAAQPREVLARLVNDLASFLPASPGDARSPAERHVTVILDDYHLIEDAAIHDALDFLLRHMPAGMHLVIASRGQPALPLARLRSQGELLEIEAADLRFTAAEVEQFFRDTMHLQLQPDARASLEMRTEGWIAGLQLAALSLQSQADPAAFIAAFSGNDRFIADYLFEEIWRHQTEGVRQFLLQTSILEQLSGLLCDAVLEAGGGQAMLEMLEARQLFTAPLDHQRHWFRYHTLFKEMLYQRLAETQPESLPHLHRAASRWYAQEGQMEAAIQHSLKAGDFERAADTIRVVFQENNWIQRDMGRYVGWFEELPESVTRARPELSITYTWLLLEIFADWWERCEARLEQVENTLIAPGKWDAFPDQETRLMLAQVKLLRANHARQVGKPLMAITCCEQALELLPEDEVYIRSGVAAHLASVYESQGKMEAARQEYSESLRLCQAAGNIDGLLFAAGRLIFVLTQSGQLRAANRVFEQVKPAAASRNGPDVGRVYISIGEVYREQNLIELAQEYLQRGLELCRPFGAWSEAVAAGTTSLANLLAAQGKLQEGSELVERALAELPAGSDQLQESLASSLARLELAGGNLEACMKWVARRALPLPPEPDYALENQYITLARVLLAKATLAAQGIQQADWHAEPLETVESLLLDLEREASAGGRLGRLIEIHVLAALACGLRRDIQAALVRVDAALRLSQTEGNLWLFLEAGESMQQLLRLLAAKPSSLLFRDFLDVLLQAYPAGGQPATRGGFLPGEQLTDRELATLRLLASESSIEEIARVLTVTPSTVRTYTKRIYSKLAVHSRAEAVYRAQALKLL